MLSNGQRKLSSRQIDGIQSVPSNSTHQTCSEPRAHKQDSEHGSDVTGVTPSSLDRSGAVTHATVAMPHWCGTSEPAAPGPHNGFSHVFEHLTPILSKMGVAPGHLEVVQENTDVAIDVSRARSEGQVRGVQVPATRVVAMRCSSSVESLNLADVHLRDKAGARSRSARSDVSFGSASSAFTCLSSSTSGSHNLVSALSPSTHGRRSLTGTISMPQLRLP